MNRLFSIILIVVGLVVVLLPDDLSIIKPPTPMDPLAQEVKTVIGDRDKEGILQLSASVKAAALLFQGDRSREAPYYTDAGKVKWAARRINELTLPAGWKMDEKYPGLASMLASYIESKLGENPSSDDIARVLIEVATSLERAGS